MAETIERNFTGGPFLTPRWLYRCGFDLDQIGVLQPGWTRATWQVPAWAGGSGGIIGDWKIDRIRRVWCVPVVGFRVPISRWRKTERKD